MPQSKQHHRLQALAFLARGFGFVGQCLLSQSRSVLVLWGELANHLYQPDGLSAGDRGDCTATGARGFCT